MRRQLVALHVIVGHGGLSLGTQWCSQCNWRHGSKVAGRRVQTAGITLLGHSRLLLRPKPAVSRGMMPGGNLASEKGKDKLLDSSCCIYREEKNWPRRPPKRHRLRRPPRPRLRFECSLRDALYLSLF